MKRIEAIICIERMIKETPIIREKEALQTILSALQEKPNDEVRVDNCKTCGHYELYKMINSGQPYGYSGDIPCLRCSRYQRYNDEHT